MIKSRRVADTSSKAGLLTDEDLSAENQGGYLVARCAGAAGVGTRAVIKT